MKNKLSKYLINRSLLIFVVIAGCFSVSYFYFDQKIETQVDEINKNKNYITSLEDKDSIIEELMIDNQKIEYQRSMIDEVLPTKENLLDFITEIEAIAEQTDNIQNLSIADKQGKLKDKDVLRIEINLLGSYESIVSYLRAIEELRYYTKIDQIEFKETQYDKLSARIDAQLFVDK